MNNFKGTCFIIMPFIPQLHYFYLYLKQYIENQHHLRCERADEQVLTVPLLEKIENYIKSADIIIADCSGRNPNVFYELGMAHTLNKKVILITSDDLKEIPSDIKHYEFIPYVLDKHIEFLDKLDKALRHVFEKPEYAAYYEQALGILHQFQQSTNAKYSTATREVFIQRLNSHDQSGQLPKSDEYLTLTRYLLFQIIDQSNLPEIAQQIMSWIAEQLPPRA